MVDVRRDVELDDETVPWAALVMPAPGQGLPDDGPSEVFTGSSLREVWEQVEVVLLEVSEGSGRPPSVLATFDQDPAAFRALAAREGIELPGSARYAEVWGDRVSYGG